jgi:NTP pyrophosphatase (non-canonical NTP hydrolase)
VDNLIGEVIKFRDERDWKQFHNPKDLAISLNLEASELLENFQWLSSEEAVSKNLDKISEELADVIIYVILFADSLGLNVNDIVRKKLHKNNEKYPVSKSYGRREKYYEL